MVENNIQGESESEAFFLTGCISHQNKLFGRKLFI